MHVRLHTIAHKQILLLTAVLALAGGDNCALSQDTLFIQRGIWSQIPENPEVLRISTDTTWTGQNAVIQRSEETPSTVVLVNLDSTAHWFTFHAPDAIEQTVPAGDTTLLDVPSLPFGTYRFGLTDEVGIGLGALGMLQVGMENSDNVFHWNLCDWESDALIAWGEGNGPDATAEYVPNYFSINEQTYPATLEDANALVSLALGDTCLISIANHGQMDHVLHFHGFHVTIMTSNLQNERIGWSKDTVPVKRGEGMTVQLIATQAGTYPVHDHNLIAVTNAGFYPGGMLTQIIVSP